MSGVDIGHQLALARYTHEPEDFDNLLAAVWWGDYAQVYGQVEQMLFHCTVARNFCDKVRRHAAIWLEDHTILLRLSNLRKNKFLESMKEDYYREDQVSY
jgi:hypothetical protein